jgi:CBS domain-containing protein
MTRDLNDRMTVRRASADPESPFPERGGACQSQGVRRLPIVTDDGSLVGLVAVDDLVLF